MNINDLELNSMALGPRGIDEMDINGMAGSIDMYLGVHALTKSDGSYQQVQWSVYQKDIKQYQGGLVEKSTVQKKFKEQIKKCKADKSLIEEYDWREIKAIFNEIFKVFHKEDGEIILSWVEEQY